MSEAAKPKTYIDADTGEAYDFVAVPRSQSRHWNRGGFFMGMLEATGAIADDPSLTDGDRTVFLKLLSRLDFENYLHVNVSELAEEMGRTRVGVSKSMKHLEDRGILHRGPRVGRSYSYRLDPFVAWRGKADARARVEREIRDRQWTVHEGGVGT